MKLGLLIVANPDRLISVRLPEACRQFLFLHTITVGDIDTGSYEKLTGLNHSLHSTQAQPPNCKLQTANCKLQNKVIYAFKVK